MRLLHVSAGFARTYWSPRDPSSGGGMELAVGKLSAHKFHRRVSIGMAPRSGEQLGGKSIGV